MQCTLTFFYHIVIQQKLMNEQIPHDPTELDKLIKNPTVVKIVNIVNLASLSMLELIEFNCTYDEINFCLKNKIIKLDKTYVMEDKSQQNVPEKTDERVNLGKKVKLTELGIYIFELLEESMVQEPSYIIPEPELSSNQNIIDFIK